VFGMFEDWMAMMVWPPSDSRLRSVEERPTRRRSVLSAKIETDSWSNAKPCARKTGAR
jgi:hypothetical protein